MNSPDEVNSIGAVLDDSQKAMLNILEDFRAERELSEHTQKALINILDDLSSDKTLMENSQQAVLNILEDFTKEKELLEETQKATLNILDDFDREKVFMEETQRAMVNIMDDSAVERERLQNTEKAILNVLEDFEQANTELQDIRVHLEEEVERRTEQLKKSNEELESFSYSVSHDLRAPLRAISGFSEILMEDYHDQLDAEGKDVVETIVRNTGKMATLIDDILEFSRLTRQETKSQTLRIRDIFLAVYDDLMQNSPERQIDFQIGELRDAMGDQTKITQLISNLLSNAIKFTGPKQDARIVVGGIEKDGEYIYFVTDNGVGFDDKYKDTMFGVFQRLHKARDFEGTGVGLAIAHRVVHHHGGRIWAESKIDEGTTIYFTLG